MRKPKGYDEAKAYTDVIKLPPGAYVVEIKKAVPGKYTNGNEYLQISFDICEGEYTDFYKKKYEEDTNEPKTYKGRIRLNLPKEDGSEQDGWTIRRLKTNMTAIEESNEGYAWDWDENTLKGLKSGLLFRNKEYSYEGRTGFWTEPFQFISADKVRTGDFKMPQDKLLNKSSQAAAPTGYEEVADEDIPF